MMPLTREWAQKAEADYDVVLLLLRSRKASRYGAICFHAQQCAEKYLKGRLVEASVSFPKTHDLAALLALALPIEPSWLVFWADVRRLTEWAVDPRYPGNDPVTPLETREAVKSLRKVRAAARRALGLKR
jgi:HEPN domain-containing protein